MIGALLLELTACLTVVGLALSIALWAGAFPTTASIGADDHRRALGALRLRSQLLRRFRAISVVVVATPCGMVERGVIHPVGGMAINPVTRGWALGLRAGVDRVRGWVEAITAGREGPTDSPTSPVCLREDLARFMGERSSLTTSTGAPGGHVPAALRALPPAVPRVSPSDSPLRRRAVPRRRTVTWLVGAGAMGAVVLGSLTHGLISRAAPPAASAIVPRGSAAGPSLRTVPAAPLAVSRSATSQVTAMTPASPLAAAAVPAAPPPPAQRLRPTVAAPAVRTVAVAPPRSTVTMEPPGMQWEVPVGAMTFSPAVTFTVKNTGQVPVTVGVVTTTDPAFRITQDGCSRTRLVPSGTCQVTVQFQASTPGHHAGALVVPDDTGAPAHRQSLTGEAR